MVAIHHHHLFGPAKDQRAMEQFQRGWDTYRKLVDHNYLGHREAYAALHAFLSAEFRRPFRFLDLACGDAGGIVAALRQTEVAHYQGIDLSTPALELASRNLEVLACSKQLCEQDFVEAMRDRPPPADVVWIGLSMHHLSSQGKREIFAEVRNTLIYGGAFLIYEPILLPYESRDAFVDRQNRTMRSDWTALTDEEAGDILKHIETSDFPETAETWQHMALARGFSHARMLFEHPARLFALFCFLA